MPANDTCRIGVYICHCGLNIASKVDVPAIAQYAATLPHVMMAKSYKFMCSDPGQQLIRDDITRHQITHLVVASCSPLMHEPTFRGVMQDAGLNPYLYQMVNIREQVSWVTKDQGRATQKARLLITAAVRRVALHDALQRSTTPINPNVLIVGAGIAGISAALTLADAGKQVYLVERDPSIGGHMAQFDKTFPTLDCAACILTPKMTAVKGNRNITLWTLSEVASVEGYVGNYKVTVRRKPRYVLEDVCAGCMECVEACVYKTPKFGKHKNIHLMAYSEVQEVSGFIGSFSVKVRHKASYVNNDACTGCGTCWEACPARRVPATRVIRMGKQIIGRTRIAAH
jgi:heterodisulfide reductase subunit A